MPPKTAATAREQLTPLSLPDHSDLIKSINKEFGSNAIQQGDTEDMRPDIASISTGSLLLDVATGVGGIPRGRVVEVYGAESAGKSTLSIHIMAEAIRAGGSAAYVDAEHALDPLYAANCGLDVDRLLICQPDYGEQALNIVDRLISAGTLDAIVVDSVASLVPEAEIQGDIGDQRIGLQARLMSQSLRKLTPTIARSKTAVVFINQLREKIGQIYGNPETTPGGRALKFYSSMRIEMKRLQQVKRRGEVIGNTVRARVVKNKVAPPFRVAEFDIIFNEGINAISEMIEAGETTAVITRNNNTYHYGDLRLGIGKEKATNAIADKPELVVRIRADIRAAIMERKINPVPMPPDDSFDDAEDADD